MSKMFKWIGILFAATGFMMLIGASFSVYSSQRFAAYANKADGVVTDFQIGAFRDDGYRAIIDFTDAAGRQHRLIDRISSIPPRFSTGERVTVLYDPAEPLGGVVDDFWGRWFLPAILGFLGVIFATIGTVFVLIDLVPRRRKAWLLKNGRPLEAEFRQVICNTSLSANGQNPFQVIAEGRNPLTGKAQFFKSQNIWFDPTDLVAGRKLRVLVDPSRPNRHVFDLPGVTEDNA